MRCHSSFYGSIMIPGTVVLTGVLHSNCDWGIINYNVTMVLPQGFTVIMILPQFKYALLTNCYSLDPEIMLFFPLCHLC